MIELDRAAETAMESLWEYREAGEFDRSIAVLRSLGHNTVAVEFALNPASYYFPNRRGTTFVRPATIGQEKIPVLALEKGTKYNFVKPSLHHLQETALQAAGLTRWAVPDAKKRFAAMGNAITAKDGDEGTATNFVRYAKIRDVPGAWIASSPVITLTAAEGARVVEPFCTGVLIHELVHVVQKLSDPIAHQRNRLRDELEAYGVVAPLIHSNAVPYSLAIGMAGEVDKTRKGFLGEDEYEPTDEFERVIRADRELSKVWYSLPDLRVS